MDIIDEIRKNAAVKNYWTKILGSDHLNAILEHPWLLEKYMVSREAQRTREAFLAFRPCEAFLKKGEQFVPEDTLFRPFALRVVGWLYMSLKPEMDYDCCGADGFYGLVKAMGEKLMSLCIRCLIGEMKERKARGELNKKFSGNPTEVVKSKSAADGGSGAEYAYFCTYYLEDYEFQNQLFLKYPVMTGMLLEKTEVWTAALKEMLCRFENDCEVLADRLGIEAVHLKITDIAWGLSDEHIYGRMVMTLQISGGLPGKVMAGKWK